MVNKIMQIEVATFPESTTKEKGDLLEDIANDFLRMQNYEVDTEVRVVGSELDLLCKHRVTKKIIYVECKAYRNTIGAGVLKQLLGTVDFNDYQEGWLISTAPLGKDAKGFQKKWEERPAERGQKLSIYTPERLIEAFINSNVVQSPPNAKALEMLMNEDFIGDWTLLITPLGRFWALTCSPSGIPQGLIIFSAKTGYLIDKQEQLQRLSQTDTSLNDLDFEYLFKIQHQQIDIEPIEYKPVVQVQHGESWSDYRPARPNDFVGREEAQQKIIYFLQDVRAKKTQTRIFAITGDSGMGKSSLITKIRNRVRNKRYKKRMFVFAVDVRAAKDPSYILASLLACFREASKVGFGLANTEELKITNLAEPLESPTIKKFLNSLEEKEQVICLVFDQFEELYSKSDLLNVFEMSKTLFFSAISAQSNLVLGFAWKSDSTVHLSHPAYHMWHTLTDHRIEIELWRFRHAEASKAITLFEKELNDKLLSSLRRQIIENSNGYPWLLKKLCIHLYDQIQAGISQSELMDKALDVEFFFKRDLQKLTQPESTCLKIIAETAPANWHEILEVSGQDTLRALIDKRLVIKSGDTLNLYWDIFREYVLTGKVPSIPLTYLPSYRSLNTVLMVAHKLNPQTPTSYTDLGTVVGLSEKTVGNVVHDLIMFGVAKGGASQAILDERMKSSEITDVLKQLRKIFANHAITLSLKQFERGTIITRSDLIELLKKINPAAQYREKTWKVYSDRMGQWLTATGYLLPDKNSWKIEDQGKINTDFTKIPKGYSNKDTIFIGNTSPINTVKALDWIMSNPSQTWEEIKNMGYRNAAATLKGLRIVFDLEGKCILDEEYVGLDKTALEIVWDASNKVDILLKLCDFLKTHPTASGRDVGEYVSKVYERNWAEASKMRTGNSLKQWAQWIMLGLGQKDIPEPLGSKSKKGKSTQYSLFDRN